MVSTNTRVPSGGASAASPEQLPSILEVNKKENLPPRRSSLGLLLRRTKSGDFGSKGSKKQQALAREQELRRQREAAAVPKNPPSLPVFTDGAALPSFGGEDRPDSVAIMSGRTSSNGNGYQGRGSIEPGRSSYATGGSVPPLPNGRTTDWVDPYARTESMTHRGRYSYASSAISTINSPRRVRRRKDPTPFK
jgi:hypothetical protein